MTRSVDPSRSVFRRSGFFILLPCRQTASLRQTRTYCIALPHFAPYSFLTFSCRAKPGWHFYHLQARPSWLSPEAWITAVRPLRHDHNEANHFLSDHWHDILVGSILGTVMGYFAYRQYYPSLASELSHRPYSPRIKRDESQDLPLRASGQYLNSDTGDNDLDGTVRRGGPGSLEEVWREGRHESVGNQQSHV